MTLKKYLSRRISWVFIPGCLGFLALHVTANYMKSNVWRTAETVELPAVFVAAWFTKNRARCPVCNERLDYIDFGSRKSRRPPAVGLDRCRGCGLHLEEEIPASTPRIE